MFVDVGEMIDDLPDQSKKKLLAKMARITRMTRIARTVARMAHWLADLADPVIVYSFSRATSVD